MLLYQIDNSISKLPEDSTAKTIVPELESPVNRNQRLQQFAIAQLASRSTVPTTSSSYLAESYLPREGLASNDADEYGLDIQYIFDKDGNIVVDKDRDPIIQLEEVTIERRVQSKQELAVRKKILDKQIYAQNIRKNSRCLRYNINKYLGKGEVMYPQANSPLLASEYCNVYNLQLAIDIGISNKPPVDPKLLRLLAPRTGTRLAIAQPLIREQCLQQANPLFPNKSRMFKIPSDFFLPNQVVLSIYNVFKKPTKFNRQVDITKEVLLELVPTLRDYEQYIPILTIELNYITESVYAAKDVYNKKRIAIKATANQKKKDNKIAKLRAAQAKV